ncbi:hypothetical protein UT300012_31220 [Paraclostridium bifermentans]
MELNKIYNMDCIEYMESLPNECVDLIIADPPYYKIVKENWDNKWKNEEEYLNWCKEWTDECFRILKPSGNFYVWGGVGKHKEHQFLKYILNTEDRGFIFQDWITWKKQKGIGSRKGYMWIREELIHFTKSNNYTINTPYLDEIAKNHGRLSKDKINYKRCGNVWVDINEVTVGNLIHTERVKHPTQKPLKACDRIINTSSNENDIVYIPFAGSGSEIIACIRNNRSYIATELDNTYIEEIIKPRIDKNNKLIKS